jgi:hypothetical protein
MSRHARVNLRELTDANRDELLALRVAPGQVRFVGSVVGALEDAAAYPHANPWYRGVYADDEPVGFVMLSWDCVSRPPEIIGPWFLWKLLIDEGHQHNGYGRDVVRLVADLYRNGSPTSTINVAAAIGPIRPTSRFPNHPYGAIMPSCQRCSSCSRTALARTGFD